MTSRSALGLRWILGSLSQEKGYNNSRPILWEKRWKMKTRRQRRSRRNMFGLRTNQSRLRRRTKAVKALMDEANKKLGEAK